MKNRKKANIILTILMIVFMLLAVIKHYCGEPFIIKMLIFIVEAALVGSIADWFAITALFEKPLGLPIKPIIPSNREKILNNLSKVVNNNLLNMNYIQNIIENMPVSETLIGIVEDKTTVHKVKTFLLTHTLNILSNFRNDKTKLINYIKGKTKDIDAIKIKVSRIIDKYIQKHFTKETYITMIDKFIALLSKNTSYTYLYNLLNDQISEKSGNKFKLFGGIKNIVDTDKLAKAIQEEGIDFLIELKVSNKKYNYIKNIINNGSQEYLNKVDLKNILDNFIDNFSIEERIDTVIDIIEDILTGTSDNSKASIHRDDNLKAISGVITNLIENLWKDIKNDKETLEWIDSVIKDLIIEIIAKNRNEFSKFVEERITGFTDSELNNLIQDSAGEPLHWIRINGAMLGAMLGLIFFSFINFLYEPFILPFIHRIIS